MDSTAGYVVNIEGTLGRKPSISSEVESKIVKCSNDMASKGMPRTKTRLANDIKKFLTKSRTTVLVFKDNKPG